MSTDFKLDVVLFQLEYTGFELKLEFPLELSSLRG